MPFAPAAGGWENAPAESWAEGTQKQETLKADFVHAGGGRQGTSHWPEKWFFIQVNPARRWPEDRRCNHSK